MDIKKIENVSAKTEQAIQRKSAYALPDRPSESGMRADEIKKAFYSSIIDKNDSVLSELKRVVNESNNIFEEMQGEINNKLTKNNIDKELSNGSENAVQNKVLYNPVVFAESERQKSKNLLCLKSFTGSYGGVTAVTDEETQTITFSGVSTGVNESQMGYIEPVTLKAGHTYCFSWYGYSGGVVSIILFNTVIGAWTNTFAIGHEFTPTEDITYNAWRVWIPSAGLDATGTAKLLLEENNQATEWQYPYGAIVHEKEILKDFWSGITDTNTWTELTMEDTANLINEYPFRIINNRNIERTTNGLVIKKAGYYYIDFNVSVERTDTTTVNFYIYVKSNDYTTVNRQSNRTGDNLRELVAGSGIIYCEIGDVIKLGMGRDNTNATGKIINLNFTIREV